MNDTPSCHPNNDQLTDTAITQCPDQEREESVMAFYAAITDVLERDPSMCWTPKAIAAEVHASANRVVKAFQRATSSKSKNKPIPVVKVGYGLYQYEAPDEAPLHQIVERNGKFGVENLVYYKAAATGRLGNTIPNSTNPDQDRSQARSKPGYPKRFKTGQVVRWETWDTGTERVMFVSNGRPFSLDWLINLHDQLACEGMTGTAWQRQSIEYNIDTLNSTMKPEYVDVQKSKALLLKAYNHGQQMRLEVADRRQVSQRNTVEELLHHYETSSGKEALDEIKKLKVAMEQIAGESRLARNIARRARDKVDEFITANKAGKGEHLRKEFKDGSKGI